jgi:hypothetical protein
MPWEGRDALVYVLVAIKTLACVDRLVTVPLVELLRRGVSEEDVLHAGDELVARAVARLMTPCRPITFFPLPSIPLSAILSVDMDALGRGGKRQGSAAHVGLYHWRRGRATPPAHRWAHAHRTRDCHEARPA